MVHSLVSASASMKALYYSMKHVNLFPMCQLKASCTLCTVSVGEHKLRGRNDIWFCFFQVSCPFENVFILRAIAACTLSAQLIVNSRTDHPECVLNPTLSVCFTGANVVQTLMAVLIGSMSEYLFCITIGIHHELVTPELVSITFIVLGQVCLNVSVARPL